MALYVFRREPSKLSIDLISLALFHWTNYGPNVNWTRDLDEPRDLDEIDYFFSGCIFTGMDIITGMNYRNGHYTVALSALTVFCLQ